MAQLFESDPRKARSNEQKHRVSFEEAQTAFADPEGLDMSDEEHSDYEDRSIRLGLSRAGRLLTIVYAERSTPEGSIIRLVSARRATRAETRAYLAARGGGKR